MTAVRNTVITTSTSGLSGGLFAGRGNGTVVSLDGFRVEKMSRSRAGGGGCFWYDGNVNTSLSSRNSVFKCDDDGHNGTVMKCVGGEGRFSTLEVDRVFWNSSCVGGCNWDIDWAGPLGRDQLNSSILNSNVNCSFSRGPCIPAPSNSSVNANTNTTAVRAIVSIAKGPKSDFYANARVASTASTASSSLL
eukprot:PhF_6_TR38089/c3_g1_i3/m.56813